MSVNPKEKIIQITEMNSRVNIFKNVSSVPLVLTNTNFVNFIPNVAFLKISPLKERYKTQSRTLPIRENTNQRISPVTKLLFWIPLIRLILGATQIATKIISITNPSINAAKIRLSLKEMLLI